MPLLYHAALLPHWQRKSRNGLLTCSAQYVVCKYLHVGGRLFQRRCKERGAGKLQSMKVCWRVSVVEEVGRRCESQRRFCTGVGRDMMR